MMDKSDGTADAHAWRAAGCEMCGDIYLSENKYSFLVAELDSCYVRLPRNQFARGWVVVASKYHSEEIFDLSCEERSSFFDDVARVAKAMLSVFGAVKINYMILGNLCPHLHCHLIPRFQGEDFSAPINLEGDTFLLERQEYEALIGLLQKQLQVS